MQAAHASSRPSLSAMAAEATIIATAPSWPWRCRRRCRPAGDRLPAWRAVPRVVSGRGCSSVSTKVEPPRRGEISAERSPRRLKNVVGQQVAAVGSSKKASKSAATGNPTARSAIKAHGIVAMQKNHHLEVNLLRPSVVSRWTSVLREKALSKPCPATKKPASWPLPRRPGPGRGRRPIDARAQPRRWPPCRGAQAVDGDTGDGGRQPGQQQGHACDIAVVFTRLVGVAVEEPRRRARRRGLGVALRQGPGSARRPGRRCAPSQRYPP